MPKGENQSDSKSKGKTRRSLYLFHVLHPACQAYISEGVIKVFAHIHDSVLSAGSLPWGGKRERIY